jgi:hypothetical protein
MPVCSAGVTAHHIAHLREITDVCGGPVAVGGSAVQPETGRVLSPAGQLELIRAAHRGLGGPWVEPDMLIVTTSWRTSRREAVEAP